MGCGSIENFKDNLNPKNYFSGKPEDVFKKNLSLGAGYTRDMYKNEGVWNSTTDKVETSAKEAAAEAAARTAEYQKVLNEALAASDASAMVAPQDYATYSEFYPKYQQVETDTAGKQFFGNDWSGNALDLQQQLSDASSKFNIGQMSKYGDSYAQQVKTSNPELYARMTAQDAMIGNLSTADGSLSAQDTRDAQQSARVASEARGLSGSNSSLITEAMNTDAMKRQRLAEGITAQQGSINNWQNNKVNPWDIINGNQTSSNQSLSNTANSGSALSSNLFNTYNNQWDTLFNANAASANTASNNDAAKKSAAIGAGASIAGAVIVAF